jgi:hypothetical protein
MAHVFGITGTPYSLAKHTIRLGLVFFANFNGGGLNSKKSLVLNAFRGEFI